jgi:hypothetical protein
MSSTFALLLFQVLQFPWRPSGRRAASKSAWKRPKFRAERDAFAHLLWSRSSLASEGAGFGNATRVGVIEHFNDLVGNHARFSPNMQNVDRNMVLGSLKIDFLTFFLR